MSGQAGFKIDVPGPFTLRITFALTKDGREEVGNLLKEQEVTRSFETIDAAMDFLTKAFKEV